MDNTNLDFNAKRTAKDSIFTHLFKDKRYTLQLYQALHPEEQDEVANLKVRKSAFRPTAVGSILQIEAPRL